jgi:putative spermidine/putrescine transport system ATP-binding protein
MSDAKGFAELRFDGVAKRYGEIVALHPTHLVIQPGEFFALLGPSGSGKTTLLGMAAGFVSPTEGRILVNGQDITRMPPERRNIGMVFQNYSLFPFLTVAANVAFPLEMRKHPKAAIASRVRQMLAMVRLEHLADRLPAELSGGQQQRVALARAAVYNPSVLLMDEPLGALDKNLREEMQDEIKRFHAQFGATIIYVTHDQHEAAFMADRIAILNHGRIEQAGPQSELYERPNNAFIAGFLGEANLLHVTAYAAGEAGSCNVATQEGLRLVVSGAAQTGRMVCIRPANITLSPVPLSYANTFAGKVVDLVHAADSIRYRVQLNDQCQISVRVTSRRADVRFEKGQEVYALWEPEDVLFMEN